MTDFKFLDRVMLTVPGVITHVPSDEPSALVEWPETPYGHLSGRVPLTHLEHAPHAPYAEPALVPGMVVGPLDETDERVWFVRGDSKYWLFVLPDADSLPLHRSHLPARIRVAFDPREATP
jgi:hypothetical protein